MEEPARKDYVQMIYALFDQFEQQQTTSSRRGHPFTYVQKVLLVFFVIMQFRRIYRFKAQWRWLKSHPQETQEIGFQGVPHRTTLLGGIPTEYPLGD